MPFPLEIGTVGLSAVGDCDLRAGGPDYVCHLESDPTIVADTSPFRASTCGCASPRTSR